MQKSYVIKGAYNNKIVYYVSTELKTTLNLPLRNFTYNIKDATIYTNLDIAISDCKDLSDHTFKVYPVCPMCNIEYSKPPAISRSDNSTEICPICGMREALINFIKINVAQN